MFTLACVNDNDCRYEAVDAASLVSIHSCVYETTLTEMTRYSNPCPSYSTLKCYTLVRAISLRRTRGQARQSEPKVATPDFTQPITRMSFVGLGHATVYLLISSHAETIGILSDPVFWNRCSPLSFAGPKRRVLPPCQLQELPALNYVVISHDHCWCSHGLSDHADV
jgi:hypothetical protein